jgi:hypothetical protein
MISGTISFFRTQAHGLVGMVTNNRISNRITGLFNAVVPDCHGRRGPFSASLQRKVLMAGIASAPILKLMQLARLILVVPAPAIYCTAGSVLALALLYLRRKPHNPYCSWVSKDTLQPTLTTANLAALGIDLNALKAASGATGTPQSTIQSPALAKTAEDNPVLTPISYSQTELKTLMREDEELEFPAETTITVTNVVASSLKAIEQEGTKADERFLKHLLFPFGTSQYSKARNLVIDKENKTVTFSFDKKQTIEPIPPTIKATVLIERLKEIKSIGLSHTPYIDIRIGKNEYQNYLVERTQNPQLFVKEDAINEHLRRIPIYTRQQAIPEICRQQFGQSAINPLVSEISTMDDVKAILQKHLNSGINLTFLSGMTVDRNEAGMLKSATASPILMSVTHSKSGVVLRICCGGIKIG